MATSVHIPKHLLDEVDRRAKRLKVSRNRFIIQALEHELASETDWSPRFFEQLAEARADAALVDRLVGDVRARRTRKGPPSL
jgi:predicted transcriptional regulator